jgi:predicted DNA-binding transcriptional regulator YafY
MTYRLISILERMYAGEALRIGELAKEFGVCTKTIQRDFYERLNKFPLRRNGQKWSIKPAYLHPEKSGINFRYIITIDILEAMAKNIGGTFASNATDMFNYLRTQNHELVIQPEVEDISARQKDFDLLSQAIEEQKRVRFIYTYDDLYTAIVEPIAFHIYERKWFLIAKERGSVKAFSFGFLADPLILDAKVYENYTRSDIESFIETLF